MSKRCRGALPAGHPPYRLRRAVYSRRLGAAVLHGADAGDAGAHRGCQQVVLCSPPPIADEILYAAQLCGVKTIFNVGGAQAIAALALGTESVPKVDKIFGPGNAYVTEAKRQVSQRLDGAAIDMPAGPSEVLVIADSGANPDFVA
jgi:histidinol dehydrogenase